MSRAGWMRMAQALVGVAILVVLVVRLGTGPFLDGLRTINVGSVVAVLALCAVTTVFAAWPWQLVASALGLDLPLRAAVVAHYRSQFRNTALPGGVLGDVRRAIAHRRNSGGRVRAARAVVCERLAGQIVQIALAAIVVAVFGAAGLGADQGVATATVFGVLVMVATLPGAVLLLLTPRTFRRRRALPVMQAAASGQGRTGHLEPVGAAAGGSERG